jgi:nickel-dependent lactate racemase
VGRPWLEKCRLPYCRIKAPLKAGLNADSASQIVKERGTILSVAACAEGLPEPGGFAQLLAEGQTPEQFLLRLHEPGRRVVMDQWEVQILAQILLRARILLKTDGLTHAQVRSAMLEPVRDLQGRLDELVQEIGPKGSIAVLPQGPLTVPYLSG